jgi:hypothetical protein
MEAAYEAFSRGLDPMDPGFEARAADILRADEVEGTDAFKRKLLLLEYLVENELRFDREPAFVYLLIAFYKEDPRCMEPLRAVCAYEAGKYPDTRDSAVNYLEMIGTRLEILRKNPAEAERRWASCRKLRPEAFDEVEAARRVFEKMARKAGPMPPPGPPKPERHSSYGVPD